jgi:MFS family permease
MTNEPTPAIPMQSPPPVVTWFKVYTGFMTGLYVLCTVAGPVLLFASAKIRGDEKVGLMVQGAVLMIVGLPLAIAFVLPFFLARKRWVWIYDLVLICIGLTSCCILPAAIPLLIYWLKPECKAWFGRM